ncbi:AraC family transcriptional regulator [Flavivirga algicola]|uniref:AraC family transcriptional regulator n=1 Tax=Flavivirga algicola TaxID=2729136 RepID=A0ABX1RXN4_9FLAO|nr:helix-turn-helix domain-containing protein [Flavivirga algicola]NMH87085.1 AraC family transcriptional regulator [Flavivirga algicola]
MNYKEYIPSKNLNSIVDIIWIATNNGKEIESKILPDGCVDIIFDLDKQMHLNSGNEIRISGMMTKFKKVTSRKNSETLGIRFKPGQFNAISNIPLSEIKNIAINASNLFPKLNNSFWDELIEKKNQWEKVQLINRFLIAEINWSGLTVSKLEHSVCESIHLNYRELDLNKVAKNHCISLRQLERRFKTTIGVTMKEYHSIIRFNKVKDYITENPNMSLLNIAFDNGYFDHSHLSKEIKKMSGLNPSEL